MQEKDLRLVWETGVWEKCYAAVLKCAGKGSAIWGSFLSVDIVISSENHKFFGLTAAFFKTLSL